MTSVRGPLIFPALGSGATPAPPPPPAAASLDQLALDAIARQRLAGYVGLLHAANAHANLTGLKTPDAIWETLVVDALTLVDRLASLPSGSSVADVGCGSGIPGLPLAIARPDLRFRLIDATAKKVAFVNHAARELSLGDASAVQGRAEALAAGPGAPEGRGPERGRHDLVTARALARLPTLLELVVPLASDPDDDGAPGGRLTLVKGEQAAAELAEAASAMRALGVRCTGQHRTRTGTILEFEKLRPTPPGFPREVGTPKRKPL